MAWRRCSLTLVDAETSFIDRSLDSRTVFKYFPRDSMKPHSPTSVRSQPLADLLLFACPFFAKAHLQECRIEAVEELKAFFLSNTKVPTGTCYDFMAPYAFMGFTKLAEEQGMWSAGAALKILDGTAPSAIPVAKNKEGSLIINTKIGKVIGAQIPFAMLQSAAQVIE